MSHTPGPWVVLDSRPKGEDIITIAAYPGIAICRIKNEVSQRDLTDEDEANARRIVACVNACAGIETGILENIAMTGDTLKNRFELLLSENFELSKQQDELMDVLASFPSFLAGNFTADEWLERRAKAIESKKGGA